MNIETNMEPVIIIGAGRSGTNMLRDLLVQFEGLATWPCDEINYIWRHGNRDFETDQFTREMASPKTADYIRHQFRKFKTRHSAETVVEKTCANSLRCGFVHEVFPGARFIHIHRDGRDVAASAALRWNAKLDVSYILKKAWYVPWSDLPWYAARYLKARVYRLFSGHRRLSTWGPKFESMQDVFRQHELPVACAIQWKECVGAASEQLSSVPSEQVLTISYEKFTADPVSGLKEVCQFLKVKIDETVLRSMTKKVSGRSVGNWKNQLSTSQINNIEDEVGQTLRKFNYV